MRKIGRRSTIRVSRSVVMNRTMSDALWPELSAGLVEAFLRMRPGDREGRYVLLHPVSDQQQRSGEDSTTGLTVTERRQWWDVAFVGRARRLQP